MRVADRHKHPASPNPHHCPSPRCFCRPPHSTRVRFVDRHNAAGLTALHAAALRGSTATAAALIRGGADIFSRTTSPRAGVPCPLPLPPGSTAMHIAALQGDLPLVRLLLEAQHDTHRAGGRDLRAMANSAGDVPLDCVRVTRNVVLLHLLDERMPLSSTRHLLARAVGGFGGFGAAAAAAAAAAAQERQQGRGEELLALLQRLRLLLSLEVVGVEQRLQEMHESKPPPPPLAAQQQQQQLQPPPTPPACVAAAVARGKRALLPADAPRGTGAGGSNGDDAPRGARAGDQMQRGGSGSRGGAAAVGSAAAASTSAQWAAQGDAAVRRQQQQQGGLLVPDVDVEGDGGLRIRTAVLEAPVRGNRVALGHGEGSIVELDDPLAEAADTEEEIEEEDDDEEEEEDERARAELRDDDEDDGLTDVTEDDIGEGDDEEDEGDDQRLQDRLNDAAGGAGWGGRQGSGRAARAPGRAAAEAAAAAAALRECEQAALGVRLGVLQSLLAEVDEALATLKNESCDGNGGSSGSGRRRRAQSLAALVSLIASPRTLSALEQAIKAFVAASALGHDATAAAAASAAGGAPAAAVGGLHAHARAGASGGAAGQGASWSAQEQALHMLRASMRDVRATLQAAGDALAAGLEPSRARRLLAAQQQLQQQRARGGGGGGGALIGGLTFSPVLVPAPAPGGRLGGLGEREQQQVGGYLQLNPPAAAAWAGVPSLGSPAAVAPLTPLQASGAGAAGRDAPPAARQAALGRGVLARGAGVGGDLSWRELRALYSHAYGLTQPMPESFAGGRSRGGGRLGDRDRGYRDYRDRDRGDRGATSGRHQLHRTFGGAPLSAISISTGATSRRERRRERRRAQLLRLDVAGGVGGGGGAAAAGVALATGGDATGSAGARLRGPGAGGAVLLAAGPQLLGSGRAGGSGGGAAGAWAQERERGRGWWGRADQDARGTAGAGVSVTSSRATRGNASASTGEHLSSDLLQRRRGGEARMPSRDGGTSSSGGGSSSRSQRRASGDGGGGEERMGPGAAAVGQAQLVRAAPVDLPVLGRASPPPGVTGSSRQAGAAATAPRIASRPASSGVVAASGTLAAAVPAVSSSTAGTAAAAALQRGGGESSGEEGERGGVAASVAAGMPHGGVVRGAAERQLHPEIWADEGTPAAPGSSEDDTDTDSLGRHHEGFAHDDDAQWGAVGAAATPWRPRRHRAGDAPAGDNVDEGRAALRRPPLRRQGSHNSVESWSIGAAAPGGGGAGGGDGGALGVLGAAEGKGSGAALCAAVAAAQQARSGGGAAACGFGDDSSADEDARTCAICMDRWVGISLGCGHQMCVPCAFQLCGKVRAAPLCPFCRDPIAGFEAAGAS